MTSFPTAWKQEIVKTLELLAALSLFLLIGVIIGEVLRLDAVRRYFDVGWLSAIFAAAVFGRTLVRVPSEAPARSFGRRVVFIALYVAAFLVVIRKYDWTPSTGILFLLIGIGLVLMDIFLDHISSDHND